VIIMADETKKEADARRLQELLQRRDSGGFLTSEEIAELDALEEAARKAAEKAAEKAARV
jgi:alkylhydroperoxidase family enzyme